MSRNAAGGVSLPVLLPVKPMVTDADGAMVASQDALVTLTRWPDWVTSPFHRSVTLETVWHGFS